MPGTSTAVTDRGKRSRSGSSTRQRSGQKKLSLLPWEEAALEFLRDQGGFDSVQKLILDRLAPEMAAAREQLQLAEAS